MSFFSKIKSSWIIHILALLHAATALCCQLYKVDDELLLTVLTMAMTLMVCLKKNLSTEFTASIIIVANIIGYLLGTMGANIMGLIFSSPYAIYPLSTLMTTEILGWSIVAIAGIFRLGKPDQGKSSLTSPYMKWLLLAAAGIFVLRIVVVLFFSEAPVDSNEVYSIIRDVISNSVGIIILICLNILYIKYSGKRTKSVSKAAKAVILTLFMAAAALIESLIVAFGLPFTFTNEPESRFLLIFIVSLFTQITIYCITYIVSYAMTARNEMQRQRERAHSAQYRYMKLKGQVNPHFLFNSLNILDCLVCEEKNEQASIYIHKLAGIYRYMIKSEEEELVKLSDELVFVGLYVDLLKVRFPEGFEVETAIDEDCRNKYILPCSLQLLIENATKHNSVSGENPLKIRIEARGDEVTICNNIIPKITKSQSTGLGHKYISRQYLDLCGKSIDIDIVNDNYCVTLPLI